MAQADAQGLEAAGVPRESIFIVTNQVSANCWSCRAANLPTRYLVCTVTWYAQSSPYVSTTEYVRAEQCTQSSHLLEQKLCNQKRTKHQQMHARLCQKTHQPEWCYISSVIVGV